MFEQKAVENKIKEIYPDIQRYGIALTVKKDKVIGGDNYVVTLEKDTRESRFQISIEDVKTCMRGDLCSLITLELGDFIKQFIDENYAVPVAG